MYCGCGTGPAKCRWFSVVALLAFAAAMWVMYSVEGNKCDVCTKGEPSSCKSLSDNGAQIDDNQTIENCSSGVVLAGFILGIAGVLAATIPCCVMCCCAKGPQANKFTHAGAPHTVTGFNSNTAPGAATPYTGPPVGGVTSYTGQPVGGATPYTGQPVGGATSYTGQPAGGFTPYMAPAGNYANASKPTV